MRVMRPSTWGKLIVGVLLIGGVLTGLWATNRPTTATEFPAPTATPAPLSDADAVVVVFEAGATHGKRAAVACDGSRTSATGFWQTDPTGACEALAAARVVLLSGPGCRHADRRRARLHVTGAFGTRIFDHRAQEGGCDGPDPWLAVNVLATPVLGPDQQIEGN